MMGMSEVSLLTAARTDYPGGFEANQRQSAIGGATASACEGPPALTNRSDETPQAESTNKGCLVRKRLENERVAREALTQKEVRGEARVAGALQKAMSGPGGPNLNTESQSNRICT